MVFSSLSFIFFFLPIFLLIYFISKKELQNIVILLGSLFFYAWGEPKYVIVMIFSIIFNYLCGLLINRYRKQDKLFLILAIIGNLLLLFVFKYLDFTIININRLFSSNINSLNLLLPIGISFYTFQAMSYVIDVYKKKVKVQKNIITMGTYVALFPQLIAGPIVRYKDIEKQLSNRTINLNKVSDGIRRFIIGLGKKVIIANNVAVIADTIFDGNIQNTGALILIIGTIAYALQIYFDFSGYSDMAIGLGKILGFDFLENFNYPYISKSITEFWRRWHISLSSWFRDYVYIPLGGNRVSKIKWIRNIFMVWFLTGLWHGASWNFILWGLYFAVILLLEKLVLSKYLDKLPSFISWIYAFILICIGWIIFRIQGINNIMIVFSNIFTLKPSNLTLFISNHYYLLNNIIYMIIGIIGMFPFINKYMIKLSNKYGYIYDVLIIIIFIISIMFLIQSTYNPFIYFRF